MRVGLGQIDMAFENKAYGMSAYTKIMQEAAKAQVDFLVFPEMSVTGFTDKPHEFGEAVENSETIQFFKQNAMLHEMAICFGMPVLKGENAENHCLILSKNGELLADYAKLHPFSFGTEAKFYNGGTALASCTVEDFTVSPFVCYDFRFPEIFQIASEKSTLLVVIANIAVSRKEDWPVLLRARAIENQAFVIGVNRTGSGGGLHYLGESLVVSPRGKILAQAGEAPCLVVADISVEEVHKCRNKFPLKADRRPALYEKLLKKERGAL